MAEIVKRLTIFHWSFRYPNANWESAQFDFLSGIFAKVLCA